MLNLQESGCRRRGGNVTEVELGCYGGPGNEILAEQQARQRSLALTESKGGGYRKTRGNHSRQTVQKTRTGHRCLNMSVSSSSRIGTSHYSRRWVTDKHMDSSICSDTGQR